jgi:hypothetical protein
VDGEATTEFIRSKGCRRVVLSQRMDGEEKTDCVSTDSILCDSRQNRRMERGLVERLVQRGRREGWKKGLVERLVQRVRREKSRKSRKGKKSREGRKSRKRRKGRKRRKDRKRREMERFRRRKGKE